VVLKIKQIKSHRCCGKVPWLLGGGTTTAMAIVVNVLMGDHQNYVCLVSMVWGREGKALMLKMDVIFCDTKWFSDRK
jgi:hypothetical protein